jgi:hypothetical protein
VIVFPYLAIATSLLFFDLQARREETVEEPAGLGQAVPGAV